MLKLIVPEGELYDEKTNEFVSFKGQVLQLEHSLVSISKWESKWHKPYLSNKKQTPEEFMDYVRCMTITQNVNPITYKFLTRDNKKDIFEYLNDPMTATIITNRAPASPNRRPITSEILYYKMAYHGIPFECQKWHLNRLLMLIKVCDIKSGPSKKMPRRAAAQQREALNAARCKRMHTRG